MHNPDSETPPPTQLEYPDSGDGGRARPADVDTHRQPQVITEPDYSPQPVANRVPATDVDSAISLQPAAETDLGSQNNVRDATTGRRDDPESLLLDLLERWEERYLGGDDAGPEFLGVSDPELIRVLRARIKSQKRLYAYLKHAPTDAVADPGIRPAHSPPDSTTPGGNHGEAGTSIGLSEAEAPQLPGYRMEVVLGRGGMGVVYRARQLSLNRPVALKVLRAGMLAGVAELRRFQNEAETVAHLDHPGIVPIYEVGEHNHQRYFSMKLVQGGSLASRIGDFQDDLRATARLVAEAAEAVHHAHLRGVLHRDLKPANILVDDQGRPHVTDFGLARRLGGDSELTQSYAILGTPAYMAPEQAAGRSRHVTILSDVYGLGAVLYALLTGEPPFRGDSVMETLDRVREQTPTPPSRLNSKVPRDLEIICLKCLDKDPQQRYPSAKELAAELGRFSCGEPIQGRPVNALERAWRWCRRRPAIAALSASVLIVATVGIAGVFLQWRIALQERDLARQNAYLAIMHLAEREWRSEQFIRLAELLESAQPKRGEADLRGFEWYCLNRFCHLDSTTIKGHDSAALRVAYSRDGRAITSIGSDGTVKIWDAASGRMLHTSTVHLDGDNSPALSPDGRKIVSAGQIGGVRIFDILAPQTPTAIQSGPGPTGSATFSSDGKLIAWIAFGGRVCVWDVEKRQESPTLEGSSSNISCLAFSPDGRRIATVDGDGKLGVRDILSCQVLLTFMVRREGSFDRRFRNAGWKLAFSPDGGRLALFGPDGAVKICDAESGKELLGLKGHSGWVNSLSFSADGRLLASAGNDGTVRVWNGESGRELSVLRGHTGSITDVAFSPDGHSIVSAGADGTVKLWEIPCRTETIVFKVLPGARFNRDRSRIGFVSQDGIVSVWEARSGELLVDRSVRIAESKSGLAARVRRETYHRIQPSPDFRYTAAREAADGTIKICDTHSGKQLFTLNNQISDFASPVFSPDSRQILVVSEDRKIHVLDVPSGDEVCTIERYVSLYHTLFSPDSRYLAASVDNASIDLWDAHSGLRVLTIIQSNGKSSQGLTPLLFSTNGQLVVSRHSWHAHSESGNFLGLAHEFKVWNARSGREVSRLEGLGGIPTHLDTDSHSPTLVFSPDNRRLYQIRRDGSVRAWDAESGRKLLELKGHVGAVNDLGFSSDCRRIVSAGHDRTVRIWDFDSGQELLTLSGHSHPVMEVSLSADGRCLTSIGSDGTVMIWEARDK